VSLAEAGATLRDADAALHSRHHGHVGQTDAIQRTFRAAVETGRVVSLRELYAPEALLAGAVAGRGLSALGPSAIVAELAGWWDQPGHLAEWHVASGDDALEIVVERTSTGAASTRQRHWIHTGADDRIARHYVYSERPCHGRSRAEGQSGARIERVVVAGGEPVVVKYLSPATSWAMRATRDTGREATLWSTGALRHLPPPLDVPILAVEPWDDGWAVVQRDVEEELIPTARRLDHSAARRLLEAMVALHRHFDGDVPAAACSLADRARLFSPDTARAEARGDDLVPKLVGRGWQRFSEAALFAGGSDVTDTMLALVADPAPLVRALESGGTTLIHGDFQHANLGLGRDSVIVIDWGLACAAPPEVELAWYLECGAPAVDATWDALIADWRDLRGADVDLDRYALALLFEVVLSGWSWALFSVESPFAAERARCAAALRTWLGHARGALDRWSP
jgi:hypothetical protein